MVVGYTTGVYDLFHIGHLNLLKNAKGLCDKLIVGVTVDELVAYKNKKSVIPFEERIEIVRSIKCVDAAIPQENIDKFEVSYDEIVQTSKEIAAPEKKSRSIFKHLQYDWSTEDAYSMGARKVKQSDLQDIGRQTKREYKRI